MAKSGMNPKTLQYIMGHSDIGITLGTYTHLKIEDAQAEFDRVMEAWKMAEKYICLPFVVKPVVNDADLLQLLLQIRKTTCHEEPR